MTKSFKVEDIASQIGAELRGQLAESISGLNTLSSAAKGQLSFLSNSKYRSDLEKTQASAVILSAKDAEDFNGVALIADDPYVAFAKAAQMLDNTPSLEDEISPSATIHPSASIGKNPKIAAGAVIDAGAKLGDDVSIGANCYVGQNAVLQDGVNLRANVTIYHSVKLGKRVSVHSGTVIGGDGFGYANDKGKWVKIPQTGSVVVGDDTEIGSNSCIDRGALDDTVIGPNVIIDNLVQIAHNCTVGEGSCICGTTGIAGSVNIGKYVILGGKVGVNGHLSICDNVHVTGLSLVSKSITKPGVYSSGMPCAPNKDWQKNTVRLRQIEKLYDRVKQLEAKISKLS